MIDVTVLFFATLKDRAGLRETSLEMPDGSRVKDLKDHLLERFPGLAGALDSALVSMNREYAFNEDSLESGAEIAIFPPVSGGQDEAPTLFAIASEDLDLNDLVAKITLPTTGAICIFTGVVRAETRLDNPHETSYLEYEAYQPMAEAKMRQVAEEIRSKWPSVEGIVIVQRVGHLNPGNPTVMIACGAPHRDSGAFEAARYGIDRLKEIVPIWKKEVGLQGEAWVEGKYIPIGDD